jgi:CRISPR/Cas system CSM-associated protein Csm3 (group 7 of RAMP superfamily)
MIRYLFEGTIVLKDALHIGSGEGSERTDALVVRDGDGNFYIPGTGFLGIFRNTVEKIAPFIEGFSSCQLKDNCEDEKLEEVCDTCKLFGYGGKGKVSKVIFSNCTMDSVINISEIRDGVSIKRISETADPERRAKFDYEVIPKGTKFNFQIELLNPSDRDKMLFSIGFNELQKGYTGIGAKTSIGLGDFDLYISSVFELDTSKFTQLKKYILDVNYKGVEIPNPLSPWRERVNIDLGRTKDEEERIIPNFCTIKYKLIFEEPFLIKSGDPSMPGPEELDARFITTTCWHENSWVEKPYLIGSSLKGVYRSRCEKIVRTLGGVACDPQEKGGERESCGKKYEEEEEIYKKSCVVCQLFGSTAMKSRIRVSSAYTNCEIPMKKMDYVAIDRFTGGAAEGKKFNSQIALNGEFNGEIVLNNFEIRQLGLLAYLFKDLYLEDVRVGYGKYKGYGKCKAVVTDVEIACLPGSEIYNRLKNYGLNEEKSVRSIFRFNNLVDECNSYNRNETYEELLEGIAKSFNEEVKQCISGIRT